MVEIYENKGMSAEDATKFIDIVSQYKDMFVDLMLVEELGLMPLDEDDKHMALKSGCVTFASFQVFGFIPLVRTAFVYFPLPPLSPPPSLAPSLFPI